MPVAFMTLFSADPTVTLAELGAQDRQRQMRRFRRILAGYFGKLQPEALAGIVAACQWQELQGGEVLFRHGDPGDAAYFLIAGRLRALRPEADGQERLLGDIRPGETVGEVAVLSDDVRGATVRAARDSVVVRLPTTQLRTWFLQYPQLLLKTAQLIIARGRQPAQTRRVEHLRTLTVLPLSAQLDITRFRIGFEAALQTLGRVRILTASDVDQALGEPGIAQVERGQSARYRHLSAWLDALEARCETLVYIANPADDAWTQRCLRQSDRVLLLADANDEHSIVPPAFEAALLTPLSSPALLVLWHEANVRLPQGTARWLQPRHWVQEVVHVRKEQPRHLQRLARLATGNAIGLVLGSGGARGLAAVGIVEVLEEEGIAIDRVGGSSIGAIMAAAVALDQPAALLATQVRTAFAQNPTHPQDLSPLPILSIYRGQRLERLLQSAFPPDVHIEDLWLNYFCISSDMACNGEVVHRRGPLWKAVRASVSLPGVFPLVRLGDGLHVDGAFLNALPVDVMAELGTRRIMAVDFSWLPPVTPDFTRVPGPLGFLKERLWRRTPRRYPLPTLLSGLIQSSLLASSQRSLHARADADVLFSPDLRRFELLDWGQFDALVRIGREHARAVLATDGQRLQLP